MWHFLLWQPACDLVPETNILTYIVGTVMFSQETADRLQLEMLKHINLTVSSLSSPISRQSSPFSANHSIFLFIIEFFYICLKCLSIIFLAVALGVIHLVQPLIHQLIVIFPLYTTVLLNECESFLPPPRLLCFQFSVCFLVC